MNADAQWKIEQSHWKPFTPRTMRDAGLDDEPGDWVDSIDNIGAALGGVAFVAFWVFVWWIV